MSTITLPENLSIDELPSLIKKGRWLDKPVDELDFSQVRKADSAILSLILFWAQNSGVPIKLTHVPEDVQTLIELYDLQTVIEVN